MAYRISPLYWPLLAVASPILAPVVFARNRRFKKNRELAAKVNSERMGKVESLDLPELEYIDVTVLTEWEAEDGFIGEPGVSYLFRTDKGSLLYDVGYGSSGLLHNAGKLGVALDQVDALAISHLHMDHMGGFKAQRSKQVRVPEGLGSPGGKPCFLPDEAGAEGFSPEVVTAPRELAAGIISTGPLARSLFMFGWTEEQALVARIKDKGLVVFSGCGHPTIEVILDMVKRLSDEPVYAIGGGLHFPITTGRGNYPGVQPQMILGTGKPPWAPVNDADLSLTISSINAAGPQKVFLSAHDTCDYALKRFSDGLDAETFVLKAGASYRV